MNQLTTEQEEALFDEFDRARSNSNPFQPGDLLRFARLYASAVSQAKGDGVVNEPEDILVNYPCFHSMESSELLEVCDAMKTYAEQFQEKWIDANQSAPGLFEGKSKQILMTNGKQTEVGHWFPDRFQTIEFEDWDEYEEKDFPWIENDTESGILWLREGYYFSTEDTRYDWIQRNFKPTHWKFLTLPQPPSPC